MKGFPNQVAELSKIAQGMSCIAELLEQGENPRSDLILGTALVRAGVAGTGHRPRPVEVYLREQMLKTPANQSFRTTARGLRELYRLMGLINDINEEIEVTALGNQAAAFAGAPMEEVQRNFWRRVIRNIWHVDAHGASYPYQALLQLVGVRPGITRAKCALALEVRNNTAEELQRIAELSDLPEDEILNEINVSQANWDNAKKVLPKFAEQLGDVIRHGQTYVLADAPGSAIAYEGPERIARRAPRASRQVDAEHIGRAGLADRSDEVVIPPTLDPAAAAAATRLRLERLRRHNLIVRRLASRLEVAGATMYEDPFDLLAIFRERSLLIEVKTLDGSDDDERDRVRDALSQLLYYNSFMLPRERDIVTPQLIACFEGQISADHMAWLNQQNIGVVWEDGGKFSCDNTAQEQLDELVRYLA